MKKILLSGLFLSATLFANSGKLVDIVSENILKVEQNGKIERIHLAGINIFANADYKNLQVTFKTKDELKKSSISYMNKLLKDQENIKFHIVDITNDGIKKVWIENHELNYKLVRDGYAIVNEKDISVPSKLKMRLSRAMEYARDKKIGLWGKTKLISLLNMPNSCSSHIKTISIEEKKDEILKAQIDALHKSSRIFLDRKFLASR